jgi:hypothetical protein
LDQVFKKKKAVCSGYSLFFIEMSKRLNVTQFGFENLDCHAKGVNWNDLSPPKKPASNHAAVVVTYNGNNFISEPTWGAGVYDVKNQKFIPRYERSTFLEPFVFGIDTHFPIGKAERFVDFPFSFNDFRRCRTRRPTEEGTKLSNSLLLRTTEKVSLKVLYNDAPLSW